ncbi:MAG: hypothetical protein KA792_09955 [Bacteroidales bacterium]|nr:hypothetical protein [Bacteroidales bacterium]
MYIFKDLDDAVKRLNTHLHKITYPISITRVKNIWLPINHSDRIKTINND